MATAQKTISKSSSYTTRALTTTISAPGIRQDAVVSVSPNVDASKLSYTINEAAGTIAVTLTNVGYTSYTEKEIYAEFVYQNTLPNGTTECHYLGDNGGAYSVNVGSSGTCSSSINFTQKTYIFKYTITVSYNIFPEFAIKANNQKKKPIDGWAKISNTKRKLVRFWVRANGQLKEV